MSVSLPVQIILKKKSLTKLQFKNVSFSEFSGNSLNPIVLRCLYGQ